MPLAASAARQRFQMHGLQGVAGVASLAACQARFGTRFGNALIFHFCLMLQIVFLRLGRIKAAGETANRLNAWPTTAAISAVPMLRCSV